MLTQHLRWDGPRHRRDDLAVLASMYHISAAQYAQAGGGLKAAPRRARLSSVQQAHRTAAALLLGRERRAGRA